MFTYLTFDYFFCFVSLNWIEKKTNVRFVTTETSYIISYSNYYINSMSEIMKPYLLIRWPHTKIERKSISFQYFGSFYMKVFTKVQNPTHSSLKLYKLCNGKTEFGKVQHNFWTSREALFHSSLYTEMIEISRQSDWFSQISTRKNWYFCIVHGNSWKRKFCLKCFSCFL